MSIPYEFRYARLMYIRWIICAPIYLALAGLTTNYLFRGVQTSATQPLISAFESTWFVWPAIFAVPLVALVGSLIRKKWIPQALVLCGAAFWMYGIALLYGTFVSGASWATASLSIALVVSCIVLGLTYARGR